MNYNPFYTRFLLDSVVHRPVLCNWVSSIPSLDEMSHRGCSNRAAGVPFGGTLTIRSEQPAPTPEPGTLTLLAGGLGALAARRRRRRASNEQRVLPLVTLGQSRR